MDWMLIHAYIITMESIKLLELLMGQKKSTTMPHKAS